MPTLNWTRILLSGLGCALVLASFSYLINELVLGKAHDAYDFFRSEEDLRINPGLGLTSLLWGVLFAVGYSLFGRALSVRGKVRHGATYGALVFVLFVAVHEVFYYQFIEFELTLLLGGLLHYAVSMTLSGALVGALMPEVSARR